MKVVTSKEMAALEKKAFQEGFDGDQFMNQAAQGIAATLYDFVKVQKLPMKLTVFAGRGNNGGDGLCTALKLSRRGFEVTAYLLSPLVECSALCQRYARKMQDANITLHIISSADEIKEPTQGVILDAILGTGLSKAPNLYLSEIFDVMNRSHLPVFSVDIPSGLSGDTGIVEKNAVVADFTIFLGLPKLGLFIQHGWDYVGKLMYVDFGLPQKLIDEHPADYELITIDDAYEAIPRMHRTRHKYSAGFVAGISGVSGMVGASIMSGMGALRTGAGIVKLIHLDYDYPGDSYHPELIHKRFGFNDHNQILDYMEKAHSIFLGPGIGTDPQMVEFVKKLLPLIDKPCVIDADALNIIAQENLAPPKNSVLTPHLGEAMRLLNLEQASLGEILAACQAYASQHEVILVLKGAPTFIFSSSHPTTICGVGDPGMATAGSGDVLTGILAGLLSQETDSSLTDLINLGVYLHGKAGEFAAKRKTSYAITATDITKSLHRTWHYILNDIEV